MPTIIILSALSCTESPKATTIADIDPITNKFYKYDLSNYALETYDILSSLGGKWISIKLKLKHPSQETRATIIKAINASLKKDGWNAQPLPKQKYVLSKIYQSQSNDLSFERKPKKTEKSHLIFNQTIHVSKNAKTICLYYELGW